jgi:hypothetical protein
MSTQLIGANPALTPPTNVSGHAVGTRYVDHRGYEYIYVKAGEAIAQYDWAAVNEAGTAFEGTKALAEDHAIIAVAQVAFANNDFGWMMTSGVGSVNALTSCAADTQLYTSATAGHLDDADASQVAVIGIRLTTAVSGDGAAAAPCVLNRPAVVMPFDGA